MDETQDLMRVNVSPQKLGLITLSGNCGTHGARDVLVKAGHAWHCPECLDAQLRQEHRDIWAARRQADCQANANIPQKHRGKTFTAATPEQRLARATAKAFADQIAKRLCWATLVLIGKPGTGKTLLACEMSESLIAKYGMFIRYTTAQGMVSDIQSAYSSQDGRTEESEVAKYAAFDLLIIDEIDAKRASANADMLLTEIINRRYNAEKPVVVISNQAFETLGQFVGDRVADRLHENSLVCSCSWPSFRRAG